MSTKRKFWTKECDDFLIKNFKTKGNQWIAQQLGFHEDTISTKLKNLSLKRTHEELSNILTNFDATKFIQLNTPEICYLLGLIWADGCIYDLKDNHKICLNLTQKDFESIQYIVKDSGNWRISKRQSKVGKPVLVAQTSNYVLWKFLVDNDYLIKSGASPDKILSKIPAHLRHYWWRGYFDGDGWICTPSFRAYSFGIVSCHSQDWNFVESLFKELNIRYKIYRLETKKGDSSSVKCDNYFGLSNFANYIYQGYEKDRIGLNRKYLKWLQNKDKREQSLNNRKCLYRGTGLHKESGNYYARITFNGKKYSLGHHKTPEEAARAFDKKAKELYGDEIYNRDLLNFPNE